MAAPTLVSATVSVINTPTLSKDLVGVSVQNGDVITCSTFAENVTGGGTIIPTTVAGSTSAWVQRVERVTLTAAGAGAAYVSLWSATATATGTITVRCTKSVTNQFWGHLVRVWRGSTGVSALGSNASTSGTPSVSVTTTGDNSGIDFVNSDWNAVQGTFAFSASNGTPVQDLADQSNNLNYCMYASHVLDAGAAGAKTIGMSLPTPQGFNAAAIEILGTAGAAPSLVAPLQRPWLGLRLWRLQHVRPASLAAAYTLTADVGTVALSGQAAALAYAPVGGVTPPSFISTPITAFNTTTSPKTTASIAVVNGDLILATVVTVDGAGVAPTVSTGSGSTSAWTSVAEPITFATAAGLQSYLRVWSANATATGNITVTFTKASGSKFGGW